MSNDKVQCKCCGMSMVPRTIFSRGLYAGWGWRIGGGRPVSSCCPFCLSENWDTGQTNVRTTTWFRLMTLGLSFLSLFVGFGILNFVNDRFFAGDLPGVVGTLPILGAIVFAWWFSRI